MNLIAFILLLNNCFLFIMMNMSYKHKILFSFMTVLLCLCMLTGRSHASAPEGMLVLNGHTSSVPTMAIAERGTLRPVLAQGLTLKSSPRTLDLERPLFRAHRFSGLELVGDYRGTENDPLPFILLADSGNSALASSAIDRQIKLFTVTLPDKFSQWLERSGRYRAVIESILRMNGLPEDLAFLPLIESGYNPFAYSRARAVGPWQFIRETAVNYGLKVNFWVDERRDPIKSTHAAARYLKELYARFESWALAMAAYNAGEGKITWALRKSQSDDYWPLLRTHYLRSETKHYVAKFIAARQIALDPEGFGFATLQYHPPLDFEEVAIISPVDLDVVADAAETTYDTIKELNPELRTWCTPLDVDSYSLRVPRGAAERFFENLRAIPVDKRLSFVAYTVKRGDTLSMISKRTGIPKDVVTAINGLAGGARMNPGMVIYLPPRDKIKLCSEIVKSQKATRKGKKRPKRKSLDV